MSETTKQSVQQQLDEAIAALRELNDYGYSLLKQMEGKPFEYSRRRHVYLLGLYLAAIAQVQGYICLTDNHQYRVSSNQMRTLYEIWVNVKFLYCSRSNVYSWHMILMSDKRKVERAARLLQQGHITQAEYDNHEATYSKRKALMAKKYPVWPDHIPGVINSQSTTPSERNKLLDLRQRCQIIDFYNAKYKRPMSKKAMSMEEHYDNLYPFFSSGTHADPIELSSVFVETYNHINANIDGSNDVEGALRMVQAVYAFQYDLIRHAKRYITGQNPPTMPSWINVYARQLKLIK